MQIHHLAIRVADPEASAAFYSGVIGLAEVRRVPGDDGSPRAIWLETGDTVLMLERVLRGSGPEAGSGHLVAFSVADLAAWEQRLARAGVRVLDRTEHTLYLADPDGHRIGLSAFPRDSLSRR